MDELRAALAIGDLVAGTRGAREAWTSLDMEDELEFLTRRFDGTLGALVANVVTLLVPARKLVSVNLYFEATGWCVDVDFWRSAPRVSLLRYDRGSLARIGDWPAHVPPPGMGQRQWELAAVTCMGLSATLNILGPCNVSS